jgi:polyisoprenoid-binding protein YceI
MKLTTIVTRTTLAVALMLPAAAAASEWQLDPSHTLAQFSVRHMMVSTTRGNFDKVTGEITLDDKDLTRSSVAIAIDASSINTRDAKRDAHLRSPDFFDVVKYPKITFKSTRIEKAGKGKFKVTGDLTMHGVTRPVTLAVEGPSPEVKTPWGTVTRGVTATGKLSRKDWGLNWNQTLDAGGVVVGDEVQLQIDAELNRKAPEQTANVPAK